MPSLIRFLLSIAVLAGLVYGAMYALVLYVKPQQREMSVRVPTDQINPVRAPQPAAPLSVEDSDAADPTEAPE